MTAIILPSAASQEQTTSDSCIAATPELRCQYPSKHCDNARTTKRGGGLHRLCSFHRARANKNQWLVDQRRRMRRERDGSRQRRTSSSAAGRKESFQSSESFDSEVAGSDDSSSAFGAEDLKILQALLFDDNEFVNDMDMSDDLLNDLSADWMNVDGFEF